MRWEMNSESGPRRNFRPAGSLARAATRWETRPGTCSPSVAAAGTCAPTSPAVRSTTTAVWCARGTARSTTSARVGWCAVRRESSPRSPASVLRTSSLTRVLPLRRGKVEERDGTLYVC